MSPAPKPTIRGRHLARTLYGLVRIYWTSPDAKWGAVLLAGAIVLQLGGVWTNVLLAGAERSVGDALGERDVAAFGRGIAFYIAFSLVAVAVPTFAEWLQQRLRIRWRRGLTDHFLARWMCRHAYCEAQLRQDGLDNPDVRIAEDIRDFVASACGLSLSLLSAIVTLVSFSALLWHLSNAWTVPIAGERHHIPGLMLWVAIAFSLLSMWVTHVVGRRLVPLNFDKIRFEADFRYGLVRYRDHLEAVTLMQGEAVEKLAANQRFDRVAGNFNELVGAQRNLGLLTNGIGQANGLVPLVVAGLAYFGDMLTLGVVAQTRFAYGQVAGGLAWFVYAYQEIARWRANIERLASFSDAMDAAEGELHRGGIAITQAEPEAIRLIDLQVEAPRGRVLIAHANATVAAGERVAVQGRAGSGRTMLLRVLAGIWPFGAGRIEEPARERMLFLTQRPYLPIGSLRAAVSYPSPPGTFPDEKAAEALRTFGLGDLAGRLDDEEPWEQKLGLHEQQRLALARVLLHEPDWVLLDEATSDLDEPSEMKAYEILTTRLPHAALIAVADRPGVLRYLPRRWTLTANADGCVALAAA